MRTLLAALAASLTFAAGAMRATSARNTPFQPTAVAPKTEAKTNSSQRGHSGYIARK